MSRKYYPVVLLQENLVTLILTPHCQQFSFEFTLLLHNLLVVIHHLLLHELLLGQSLCLGLFLLATFKFHLLSSLLFLPLLLLSVSLGLQSSLLGGIFIQKFGLFVYFSCGWNWGRGGR